MATGGIKDIPSIGKSAKEKVEKKLAITSNIGKGDRDGLRSGGSYQTYSQGAGSTSKGHADRFFTRPVTSLPNISLAASNASQVHGLTPVLTPPRTRVSPETRASCGRGIYSRSPTHGEPRQTGNSIGRGEATQRHSQRGGVSRRGQFINSIHASLRDEDETFMKHHPIDRPQSGFSLSSSTSASVSLSSDNTKASITSLLRRNAKEKAKLAQMQSSKLAKSLVAADNTLAWDPYPLGKSSAGKSFSETTMAHANGRTDLATRSVSKDIPLKNSTPVDIIAPSPITVVKQKGEKEFHIENYGTFGKTGAKSMLRLDQLFKNGTCIKIALKNEIENKSVISKTQDYTDAMDILRETTLMADAILNEMETIKIAGEIPVRRQAKLDDYISKTGERLTALSLRTPTIVQKMKRKRIEFEENSKISLQIGRQSNSSSILDSTLTKPKLSSDLIGPADKVVSKQSILTKRPTGKYGSITEKDIEYIGIGMLWVTQQVEKKTNITLADIVGQVKAGDLLSKFQRMSDKRDEGKLIGRCSEPVNDVFLHHHCQSKQLLNCLSSVAGSRDVMMLGVCIARYLLSDRPDCDEIVTPSMDLFALLDSSNFEPISKATVLCLKSDLGIVDLQQLGLRLAHTMIEYREHYLKPGRTGEFLVGDETPSLRVHKKDYNESLLYGEDSIKSHTEGVKGEGKTKCDIGTGNPGNQNKPILADPITQAIESKLTRPKVVEEENEECIDSGSEPDTGKDYWERLSKIRQELANIAPSLTVPTQDNAVNPCSNTQTNAAQSAKTFVTNGILTHRKDLNQSSIGVQCDDNPISLNVTIQGIPSKSVVSKATGVVKDYTGMNSTSAFLVPQLNKTAYNASNTTTTYGTTGGYQSKKLPENLRFDGKHQEEYEPFRERFRMYSRSGHWTEQEAVNFLVRALRPPALDILTNSHVDHTYSLDSHFLILDAFYKPAGDEFTPSAKFWNRVKKPDETVRQFLIVLRGLLYRAHPESADTPLYKENLRKQFIIGLPSELTAKLQSPHKDLLEDMAEFLDAPNRFVKACTARYESETVSSVTAAVSEINNIVDAEFLESSGEDEEADVCLVLQNGSGQKQWVNVPRERFFRGRTRGTPFHGKPVKFSRDNVHGEIKDNQPGFPNQERKSRYYPLFRQPNIQIVHKEPQNQNQSGKTSEGVQNPPQANPVPKQPRPKCAFCNMGSHIEANCYEKRFTMLDTRTKEMLDLLKDKEKKGN